MCTFFTIRTCIQGNLFLSFFILITLADIITFSLERINKCLYTKVIVTLWPHTDTICLFIRPQPAIFASKSPSYTIVISVLGTCYLKTRIVQQARKSTQDFFSSDIHCLQASVTLLPSPIFLWNIALRAHTRLEGLRSISSTIYGTALPPILTIRRKDGCLVIVATDDRNRVSRCHSSRYLAKRTLSSDSFMVFIRKATTACLSFRLISLISPI